jgi:nucleoporin GLE1
VALDVFGPEAKSVWGQQWIKMLALLCEGVAVGLGGDSLVGRALKDGRRGRVFSWR